MPYTSEDENESLGYHTLLQYTFAYLASAEVLSAFLLFCFVIVSFNTLFFGFVCAASAERWARCGV